MYVENQQLKIPEFPQCSRGEMIVDAIATVVHETVPVEVSLGGLELSGALCCGRDEKANVDNCPDYKLNQPHLPLLLFVNTSWSMWSRNMVLCSTMVMEPNFPQ